MTFRKSIFPPLLALMIVFGAFFIATPRAYALAGTPDEATTTVTEVQVREILAPAETLTVDDVWLTGDTLHIAVTDKTNGGSQTLELNLSDYAKATDEYVTVRATDTSGRVSNAIQFKNPYYIPPEESTENGGIQADATAERSDPSESSVQENNPANNSRPLTPDGTGSVMDNVTENDGKEFFTVETADGNVFYLIVDRQRNVDNVYLLNAVTENDLASLAKPGNGTANGSGNNGNSISGVTTSPPLATSTQPEITPNPTPEPTQKPESEPESTPEPEPEPQKKNNNMGMLGIMAVVLIVVGGIGYYFKIVRPKQAGYDDESEEDSEPGDDYDEPGEEEPISYATDEDERIAEEGEVSDE